MVCIINHCGRSDWIELAHHRWTICQHKVGHFPTGMPFCLYFSGVLTAASFHVKDEDTPPLIILRSVRVTILDPIAFPSIPSNCLAKLSSSFLSASSQSFSFSPLSLSRQLYTGLVLVSLLVVACQSFCWVLA